MEVTDSVSNTADAAQRVKFEIVCDSSDGKNKCSYKASYASYKSTRYHAQFNKYRIGPYSLNLYNIDGKIPGKLVPVTRQQWSKRLSVLDYVCTVTSQKEEHMIDLYFMYMTLDIGADINARDELGQSALQGLVHAWHADVTSFALDQSADPNSQDKYGRSPLHLAAALNRRDVVVILINYGADPLIKTYGENQTPAHYAAKHNSTDALAVLLDYRGSVESRDSRNRTPLFVAAESRSLDTTRYLLNVGAPTSVYDVSGTSILAVLVQKIPLLALPALDQYQTLTKVTYETQMYLGALEYDQVDFNDGGEKKHVKTALELITARHDVTLVMHPVIQKAIQIKWKLFGRKSAIFQLLLTILVVMCWLVFAFFLDDDSSLFYNDDDQWKYVFEVLIVVMTLYFFIDEKRTIAKEMSWHNRWIQTKLDDNKSQYVHCHPAWPKERENLPKEISFIKAQPSLVMKPHFWYAFECFQLLLLASVITTRVLAFLYPSSPKLLLFHKITVLFNIFYAAFRVFKTLMKFKCLALILSGLSQASTPILQICFFYMQIYIPSVAAFWLMFGVSPLDEKMALTRTSTSNFTSYLPSLFYNLFTLQFAQDEIYKLDGSNAFIVQAFIAIFHALTTCFALSVVISFVQVKCTSNYKRNLARVNLSLSKYILECQRSMSVSRKETIKEYYKAHYSPLIVPEKECFGQLRQAETLRILNRISLKLKKIDRIVHVHERFYKRDCNTVESRKRSGVYKQVMLRSKKAKTFKTWKDLLVAFQLMSGNNQLTDFMLNNYSKI